MPIPIFHKAPSAMFLDLSRTMIGYAVLNQICGADSFFKSVFPVKISLAMNTHLDGKLGLQVTVRFPNYGAYMVPRFGTHTLPLAVQFRIFDDSQPGRLLGIHALDRDFPIEATKLTATVEETFLPETERRRIAELPDPRISPAFQDLAFILRFEESDGSFILSGRLSEADEHRRNVCVDGPCPAATCPGIAA